MKVTLKNRKPNFEKLKSFGFEKTEDTYIYRCNMADNSMQLTITVTEAEEIYTEVTDWSGEEYVLHNIPETSGAFVGQIRTEYEACLTTVAETCFDPDIFKSEQTKQLITFVRNKYGDELEFLWKKFPDNAIWRRKDNRKWYGAILTVSLRKLGFDCDETAEIIDLRIKPEEMQNTIDNITCFPGYHMNKNHWYTIILNQSVPTGEICDRITQSYDLAKK